MRELTGRVAVVTGAASGIGRALAQLLVAEGMKVVLADIEAAALGATASEFDDLGADIHVVPTDVSDAVSVAALAEATVSKYGAVHLVCNNAGVSGTFARTWMTSPDDWRWVLGVNVWGVINGISAFVPILLEQEEGHILNTGSAACFEALPGMGAYAASKHAVLGISESLRRELVAAGGRVGVSVFIPGGVINTKILESERNWPDGVPIPERDPDMLPTMIRSAFSQAFAAGVDPRQTVGAAIEGIKTNTFLVSDDPTLLAEWGAHHATIATGAEPVWP